MRGQDDLPRRIGVERVDEVFEVDRPNWRLTSEGCLRSATRSMIWRGSERAVIEIHTVSSCQPSFLNVAEIYSCTSVLSVNTGR